MFLKLILGDAFLAPVRRLLGGTRLVHILSQRIKESVFRKRRSNQRTLSKITAHHDQRLQICDRIDASGHRTAVKPMREIDGGLTYRSIGNVNRTIVDKRSM